MRKEFVTFYCPGTLVAETIVREVKRWDKDEAVAMSRSVTARYDARPYAFRFHTRERGPEDLDSKITRKSPLYFLGGRIDTLEDIEARGDPRDEVLLSNMRSNGYRRIITTTEGWRWTQPLDDSDVVIDMREYD